MIDGRIAFGETHLFVGRGTWCRFATALRVLRRCARALRVLPDGPLPRRRLHPLRHPRFHRRQLHAGAGDAQRRWKQSRTACSPSAAAQVDVQRLYMMRRDLLRLRNAVAPLVEVCRRLEHAEVMAIDAAMQPLFRDVTDHVRRVQEEIDALREVLAFAFEASLMAGQAQQTAITRGWRPGPPSSRCRPRSPASTA